MIVDALRYPIADEFGRTALLRSVVTVVAVAVGVRYAAALSPSSVALVPAAVALVGLVFLLGTTALVLVPADRHSRPSARTLLRPGLGALALSIAVLAPSIVLLAWSLTAALEGLLAGDDAALFSLVSSTAAVFFFLACAYVYPTAVATSAAAGRVRAAADADALLPAVTDPGYFLRWTVGFSLAVLATWLTIATIDRGDVLGVVAAAVAAYLLVAGARAVGVGYARTAAGPPS
ncbi:hypothetical protein [Halosolutus gelatinilyticus]|uniref:hypothetical protein n=1 Tax=Halosolutus gelatinilyticus TaxID=2931975 RepID=UPI001FF2F561|nr:hypothetical protein [Halosolutus gelatinilyticus]